MNNEITLTVEGWVARSPQQHGREDSNWVTFRIGSTAWWWDAQGERRDAPTTWFDVKVSQRDLAENVLLSVKNGDAVIVSGRLSQHYWTDRDGKERSSLQIAARSVGPNLRWGKALWCRRVAEAPAGAPAAGAAGTTPAEGGGVAADAGGESVDCSDQAFALADAALAGDALAGDALAGDALADDAPDGAGGEWDGGADELAADSAEPVAVH
ncbi:MAG: single-stranded DNA-binding protein [Bifidobacteriaceae bacterium]|jgi:single-strand DNA-binding protein|nr:single-stranded DNA-binding protein [Bifidobacteriaceae bacterium]